MLDHSSQSCFGQAAIRKYSEGLEWIEDLDQIGGAEFRCNYFEGSEVHHSIALYSFFMQLCSAAPYCTIMLMIFVVEPFHTQYIHSTYSKNVRQYNDNSYDNILSEYCRRS